MDLPEGNNITTRADALVAAPTLTVNSGTTAYGKGSSPVAIDPNLTLTGPDGLNLTGAMVSISSGFLSSEDRLSFTSQGGVSGAFNNTTGVLSLSGSASVVAYQAVLRSVSYQNISSSPSTAARKVTFSIGQNSIYSPDTGHYYEYVSVSGIGWDNAKTAAAAKSYYGMQGYLVTVTSAAENAFIKSKLAGNTWMGAQASGFSVPRTWSWATGPEAGQTFFTQTSNTSSSCSSGARGSAVGGKYHNWDNCEPNTWGGTEDVAHFYSNSGTWNDFAKNNTNISGYVVEYGGMSGDSVLQLSGTRNLSVSLGYVLTPIAGASGTISPSTPQTVAPGGSQTFTITPATGYEVADVKVDGTSVGARTSHTFSNVTASHTIAATFAIKQYTLIPSAGANGTISPSSAQTVNHGGSQSFTIAPNTEYEVADVAVDGTSVGAVTSYAFSNVTASHTIAVTFAIKQYTLTPSAGANGTIAPSTAQTVNHGGSQTFTINPADGYEVADVEVDGTSVGAVATYAFSDLAANHTIAATFSIKQYTLTPTAGPNGTISPATAQTVNHGGSQAFTISPRAAYKVADVKVDGTSVGAVTSYTFSNVTANHTIAVTFALADIAPILTVNAGAAGHTWGSPPVPVDPNLTLTDSDGPDLTGAMVSISSGFVSSEDRLSFTSQGGIGGTFNTTTGVLTLSGSASVGTYEAVLRSVAYKNVATGIPSTAGRKVTFSIGQNSIYSPDTGHYYEYVSASGIGWDNAKTAAAAKNYYGMQGYLVTVTSAAENAFIKSKLAGKTWMGASTSGFSVPRTWSWATGPEAGQAFFTQTSDTSSACSSGPRGNAVDEKYHNWAKCEPNTASGTEDVAHFYSNSGTWNDFARNNTNSSGYVVEYGGMSGDPALQLSGTRDVEVSPGYVLTPSAGANGSISPSTAQTVAHGGSQTFAITPAIGYHVLDVLVDGASVGAVTEYTVDDVTSNHTIAASFAINQYAIVGSAVANGSVSCTSPVLHGGSATCTVTPEPGWILLRLMDEGVDVTSSVSDGTYVIGSVTGTHSVIATMIKGQGTGCGSDGECGSGFCVDGVCCNASCEGDCQACSVAAGGAEDGACAPLTGTSCDDGDLCTQQDVCEAGTCNGKEPVVCAALDECHDPGTCDPAHGTCSNPESAELTECDGGNGRCVAGRCKAAQGQQCQVGSECVSSYCVDGRCCDKACSGQCEACDVSGHEGTCVAVTGAPHGDRPACASDGTACGGACDGVLATACRYPASSTPCRAASCASGTATLEAFCKGDGACSTKQTQECSPFACGDTQCLGNCERDTDCASGFYCSAGLCAPKKPAGQSCGRSNECAGGHCVDDFCCNVACEGQCEACDIAGSEGQCTPVLGAPRGTRQACATDGTACGGACDGSSSTACAYPDSAVSCREASCSNGVATHAASCDGSGQCPAIEVDHCRTYACGETACRTGCTSDAECAETGYCRRDGTCGLRANPDEWNVTGSGGCSSQGTNGAALFVLLVWAGLALRRRRRAGRVGLFGLALLPALAWSGTAWSANAPASTEFQVQRFQPSAGTFDLFSVQSARTPGHLNFGFVFFGNYASQPLRLVSKSDPSKVIPLLESQTTLDIGATLGLFDRYEVSFAVPFTVSQRSQAAGMIDSRLEQPIASAGLGDLRISPKARVWGKERLSLAVAIPVTLPSGNAGAYLGHAATTVHPRVLAELEGPVRVAANLGVAVRGGRDLLDLHVGSAFSFAVGGELPGLLGVDTLAALGGVVGEVGLSQQDSVETPVEAALGVRWNGPDGMIVSFGAGVGLTQGYGTPQYRLLASVGWVPERALRARPFLVVDDRFEGVSGGGIELPVLANDSGPGVLKVAEVSKPEHGTVAVGEDGVLHYSPEDSFVGTEQIRYVVTDAEGHRAEGVATVVVGPALPQLVVAPDSFDMVAGVPAELSVLVNDSGSGELEVVEVSAPESGTAVVENGVIRYSPRDSFEGTESIRYVVVDGAEHRGEGVVTVTVKAARPVLAAGADAVETVAEAPVEVAVLANDSGIDIDDEIQVTEVSKPAHGTASLTASGTVRYLPKAGFAGTDRFRYTVSNAGRTASGEVVVTVLADRDGDRIADAKDRCPEKAGSGDGCPKEEPAPARVEGQRIVIVEKVHFATNKDAILPSSLAVLQSVAEVLKSHGEIRRVRIEGHTDDEGAPSANKELSERRASSVRKFLIDAGIAAERLESAGFGDTRSIAPNSDDEGKATNRRVEFVIVDPSQAGTP